MMSLFVISIESYSEIKASNSELLACKAPFYSFNKGEEIPCVFSFGPMLRSVDVSLSDIVK